MRNSYILLLILLFQIDITGQAAVSEKSAMDASIAINTLAMNNFKTTSLKYKDVKGTPYLEKNGLQGHVVMIDEQKTGTVALQYDIYSNEFFHINDKGEEVVLELKLIKEIFMQGKEESYVFKRVNPLKPLKFYEVLYESQELDIYNDLQINFYEGKEQGITKIEPRFSKDNHYYAHLKGKEPKKIKLKKKDVYKFFSKEEKKQMDDLVKKNKIKLKKSKEFKQLFDAMKS